MDDGSTFFAPMIYLDKVAPAIEFYKKAFDAIELRRWSNDDRSVHVAEFAFAASPAAATTANNHTKFRIFMT